VAPRDRADTAARQTQDEEFGMRYPAIAVAAGLLVARLGAGAQAPPPADVDRLVSAAKVSAGLEWPGTFLRLCVVPPPAAAAEAASPGPPDRARWHAEPAKVADNLYFLGTKVHNAWALVGSDGIIVIEALFDYAAPDEIIGGMKTLGLDAGRVKYVIISHAHADHDGGAKFLQDALPSAHLVYGAPDWDAVDRSTDHAGGKPRRDTVAADGMTFSVGDASVRVVTTPGHTPGTISYLFEARDNGRPLRVAYVGGTAIRFEESPMYYDEYIASTRKMARAAAGFGATVVLSNHTEFDNAVYKAHAAADRRPGEMNPFDVGTAAVGRYFALVEDCATAAKLRAGSQR
jgi:metallo-beta-lactamase class B